MAGTSPHTSTDAALTPRPKPLAGPCPPRVLFLGGGKTLFRISRAFRSRHPTREPAPEAAAVPGSHGEGRRALPAGAARAILGRAGSGHMVTAGPAGPAPAAPPGGCGCSAPAASAGPARPANDAGGARGALGAAAGTAPRAGAAGARRAARDSTEPPGTSDLRSPGRPGPPRGPADNRAGTAGLVPGSLHCPAATRPLPGLAALSRGRSREGQGAAGPGTQVPGRARHRGRRGQTRRWRARQGEGGCGTREPYRPARRPPGAGTALLTSPGGRRGGSRRSPLPPPSRARRS